MLESRNTATNKEKGHLKEKRSASNIYQYDAKLEEPRVLCLYISIIMMLSNYTSCLKKEFKEEGTRHGYDALPYRMKKKASKKGM